MDRAGLKGGVVLTQLRAGPCLQNRFDLLRAGGGLGFDAGLLGSYRFRVLDPYALPVLVSRLTSCASASDSSEPGKRAAVAAILRPGQGGGSAELLLVRRAEHPSDPWSGHMALPGGRRDEADADLCETVVRETREEVGIDLLEHGTRLVRLPDHPATVGGRRVGLVIAPFVFALHGDPELIPDDQEIAEVVWTPLGPLARGEGTGTFEYEHQGMLYELPYLDVGGRRVWGLTYQMLQQLFHVLHS